MRQRNCLNICNLVLKKAARAYAVATESVRKAHARMEAVMEEKTSLGPHKLLLQGRKSLELTGVKDVVSFDAKEVVLNTVLGALIIRGNNLVVKRLTLEQGEVDLDGQIDSLLYADKAGKAGEKDALLKRLFR